MPAKLTESTARWTGRLAADDLALLELVYGHGKVNRIIRDILAAYCNSLRARGWKNTEPV